MASGKSLELAAIKPIPQPLCICGVVWGDHFRKDGQPLAKYGGSEWKNFLAKHRQAGARKGDTYQKPTPTRVKSAGRRSGSS
jgi:hypothetical protein